VTQKRKDRKFVCSCTLTPADKSIFKFALCLACDTNRSYEEWWMDLCEKAPRTALRILDKGLVWVSLRCGEAYPHHHVPEILDDWISSDEIWKKIEEANQE